MQCLITMVMTCAANDDDCAGRYGLCVQLVILVMVAAIFTASLLITFTLVLFREHYKSKDTHQMRTNPTYKLLLSLLTSRRICLFVVFLLPLSTFISLHSPQSTDTLNLSTPRFRMGIPPTFER